VRTSGSYTASITVISTVAISTHTHDGTSTNRYRVLFHEVMKFTDKSSAQSSKPFTMPNFAPSALAFLLLGASQVHDVNAFAGLKHTTKSNGVAGLRMVRVAGPGLHGRFVNLTAGVSDVSGKDSQSRIF
jgi:hypothetical protein